MRKVNLLFVLCGGKFYMDYLLITNPTSKNILIRLIFGWAKGLYSAKWIEGRYISCYCLGIVHLVAAILNYYWGVFFSMSNLLINIYPIVVQVYIGYRLLRVIRFKKRLNNRLNNDYEILPT